VADTTQRRLAFDGSRRVGLRRIAEWLAVCVAMSLPWSTSATSILIALWLIALLPTLEAGALRREVATAAGGFPVLLWLLAAVGMLWADVDWSQRLSGLGAFHKLLMIPLLLHQFRSSDKGEWVLLGFLASCVALLATSWAFNLWPAIAWRWTTSPGVPVKDYILQSVEFFICAFGAGYLAGGAWRSGRWTLALGLVALSVAFVSNIVFVSLGRTSLATAPVLFAVVGWRHLGLKGAVIGAIATAVLAVLAWNSSAYLRERVITLRQEIQLYEEIGLDSSAGKRLEWWQKSIRFVKERPILGQGTGSIRSLFVQAQGSAGLADAEVTPNPHNQIFFVALQLGAIGGAILLAMWVAHFRLFRASGTVASIGLLVVVQNIVGSLFNSHLLDFTQGWIYVFGVGVCGGVMLRRSAENASAVRVVESDTAFPPILGTQPR
jgi:O-antigen ligase